ncbi:MAG: HAD-IB family hydrolase [SAR86 cluster bacterium]|uniref:HAD-IB family hydrolase n=1 Tax=SAR86 cluster bacterium TaxID=2030880 RepID=A0A2A4MSA9_9GAMM|nr:MAG: HAD-IB family hydrolase [SAR86 cluster bacterium]
MSKRLALFDLDNTLLGGDSDHAWGEFLIAKELVDSQSHSDQNNAFYLQYQQGKLDVHAYVKFTLAPVLSMSLNELAQLHTEFMQDFVRPMMLPAAIELIESHKAAGDTCLIISATNTFITTPIAKAFAIEHLLGTDLVIEAGRYSGEIAGTPCFQAGKIDKLKQWLATQDRSYNIGESCFYSDSINDLPLMELVKDAVAVDPDDSLRLEAEKRGWRILSLR